MKRSSHGFILPTILVVSIIMMAAGLSLVQLTSSIRSSLASNYANKLANEAADAGVVYAKYCYTTNANVQKWSVAKPLTQSTDCSGNVISSYPDYLETYNNYRTGFTVGDISTTGDGTYFVSASGTTKEVAVNDTNQTVRSFSYNEKQVLNLKTLQASVSSSGTAKTCAIISGELYCWGSNSGSQYHGQLGDGTTTDSLTPRQVVQDAGVLLGKTVIKVASAQFHSCALTDDQKMYCWGDNSQYQLGATTPAWTSRPVQVKGALDGKAVTAIAADGDTSCAIADGKLYCWGGNTDGTAGVDSNATRISTPTLVNEDNLPNNYRPDVLATSGSRSTTMCAVINDRAYCWGNNMAGSIGNGTTGADVRKPTAVSTSTGLGSQKIVSISQDGYYNGGSLGTYMHVCAVTDSGQLYCWGENSYGQLGIGNAADRSTPVQVNGGALLGKIVNDVVVGLRHSCALASGQVFCWGNGGEGVIGNGSNAMQTSPVAVAQLPGGLQGKIVTAIGGGANRGCAIADFKSYCWGYNTLGQLGDGTQTNRNTPVRSIFLDPKPQAFLF